MNTKKSSYHGYRFPAEIISHAVRLYHRFCLSLRDVEDLLAERGIEVSYESIRHWCAQFGPEYAHNLRKRRGALGDTWYLDEVFITIRGENVYLWRAYPSHPAYYLEYDPDHQKCIYLKRVNANFVDSSIRSEQKPA